MPADATPEFVEALLARGFTRIGEPTKAKGKRIATGDTHD